MFFLILFYYKWGKMKRGFQKNFSRIGRNRDEETVFMGMGHPIWVFRNCSLVRPFAFGKLAEGQMGIGTMGAPFVLGFGDWHRSGWGGAYPSEIAQ